MKKSIYFLMMVVIFFAACNKKSAAPIVEIYPNKNVSIIVPYSAGGGSDSITRALVDVVKDDFHNKISVENRVGGAGAVGMLYGANSKPNGNIISMIAVELTMLPHTGTGGNLEPSLFKPVMMFNSDFSVLTVRADSDWNTLEDFINAARDSEIQIGNSGVGSIWHFAAAALGKSANVDFTYIPFEGAAPAVTSLLGGHIDAVSVSYGEVVAYVSSGDFKVLAALAPDRLETLPDIPTALELGYDAVVGTWRGLAVPKDTSQELVDKIYDIFQKAVQTEKFRIFMENNKFIIKTMNPSEFQKQIDKDFIQFGQLAKVLGLAK